MSKFDTFKSGNLILKIAEVDASIVSPANNSKYVDTKCTFESGIFRLYLRPKRAIQVRHIAYEIDYAFEKDEAFFANGYQSWTDTREFKKGDKIHDLGLIGKTTSLGKIFVNAGDYSFARYNKRRSLYHGISYGYMRLGSRVCLLGSLYERNGYTIIYADMVRNKIIIEKDLSGVIIEDTKPYLLFEVFTKTGKYDEVFDAYFDAFNVKLRTTEKLKGYTSWYNYYSNISEEIVLRDLNGLASATSEINAFQIDDGYQTAVGDWLSVDAKKFPNGMKAIADAIHSKNIKAGIWLAPLAAESKSQIFAEHPDWFIQQNGKPKIIGPNWSKFYGLNFYKEEVRAHIRNFFNVVLNDWGYDLVKLDFLYAASAVPLNGRTRAGAMYDAMEFIRECVGDKLILGCGVPIVPCFNLVDYMRIGADMGLSWSQGMYAVTTHREDVNTRNAIHNGLMRRHLNGRAFLNDPDVFLLRDYSIGLSWDQRKLLSQLIKLTAGVLFISDDVARYDEKQKEQLQYMLSETNIKVRTVDLVKDVYTIVYEELGVDNILVFSLKNGKIIKHEKM